MCLLCKKNSMNFTNQNSKIYFSLYTLNQFFFKRKKSQNLYHCLLLCATRWIQLKLLLRLRTSTLLKHFELHRRLRYLEVAWVFKDDWIENVSICTSSIFFYKIDYKQKYNTVGIIFSFTIGKNELFYLY